MRHLYITSYGKKTLDDTDKRFDTIPAMDSQTDGQKSDQLASELRIIIIILFIPFT